MRIIEPRHVDVIERGRRNFAYPVEVLFAAAVIAVACSTFEHFAVAASVFGSAVLWAILWSAYRRATVVEAGAVTLRFEHRALDRRSGVLRLLHPLDPAVFIAKPARGAPIGDPAFDARFGMVDDPRLRALLGADGRHLAGLAAVTRPLERRRTGSPDARPSAARRAAHGAGVGGRA